MSELDDDTLSAIADKMLADYDRVSPGTVFADGLRLSIPDAWRLQTAVASLREQRGETVVGYKIGCVSAGNQKMIGLTHPVWGRLWSTEQHGDGAVLEKAGFANLALEAEFAITLSRAVDPKTASPEELLASVGAVYPVIELHNLVLRSDPPHGHELIANNGILAGVVSGQGMSDPGTPLTTDLALKFDGKTVDSWAALRWPDDILSSVAWLAEKRAEGGQRLERGDVILTGAFGPPIPLDKKNRVDVTSSAFGNVSATFI
ncbi:MAG: 2-keto-4-pentenoate hydratase [Geminicoccaceae bacterium]